MHAAFAVLENTTSVCPGRWLVCLAEGRSVPDRPKGSGGCATSHPGVPLRGRLRVHQPVSPPSSVVRQLELATCGWRAEALPGA
eukprot:7426637-Alexandrium_andersonii.AAC.1